LVAPSSETQWDRWQSPSPGVALEGSSCRTRGASGGRPLTEVLAELIGDGRWGLLHGHVTGWVRQPELLGWVIVSYSMGITRPQGVLAAPPVVRPLFPRRDWTNPFSLVATNLGQVARSEERLT
jgi:hypothetical protein